MGINAAVGFLWKGGVRGGMAPEAWDYWWVCVPIVVAGTLFFRWMANRGVKRLSLSEG
jgi:hypothetical protein